VTLPAERPVVEKETVPVERVRLATEMVTSEETVSEQVRKEQPRNRRLAPIDQPRPSGIVCFDAHIQPAAAVRELVSSTLLAGSVG
jgi:hypothetical protein